MNPMLDGATCTESEAWAGEAGVGICLPEHQGPTTGRRPDSRRRRQVGAGKGLEFKVGWEEWEEAARAQDPRW